VRAGTRPEGTRSGVTAAASVPPVDEVLRRRSVGAPAARSLLLTVLGEFVLPRPEGVAQEALVAALGALGVTPAAARQAVARSAREGWLAAEREGRRARMRLTPETAAFLREGAERIYGFGAPAAWDGRWLLVALRVAEDRRRLRHRVTTRLAWAGFGSLGGGLWISPHVEREGAVREALDGDAADGVELLSFRAERGALGGADRVIGAAWGLPDVREHYEQFLADFRAVRPRTPARAFAAQTGLVHAWRRFPFIDPDLPDELLPPDWPRRRAHALFHERHARWAPGAEEFFAAVDARPRAV
jgi:phenylacetic acid degradation operon negative regulatory protein